MMLLKFVVVLALAGVSSQAGVVSPRSVADELVAADRAFAAASAKTDVISGLSAMFADDVVITHPGGLAYGKDKAIDALKANPTNAGGRIEWAPARVSVSGDGRHGFTAGFMTLHRADNTTTPLKYLAYWAKQPDGWRVLTYKRGLGKTPAPPMPLTYVLPQEIRTPKTDAAAIEQYRASLADVERAFSAEAQKIGIGPAFEKYGDPEAINLGPPDVPTWVLGNARVAGSVGAGAPTNSSPVSWGPDKTIVAASGDFGVTIGFIVPNKPGADGKLPPGQPFFTIWKRDSPSGKWLYIAE